MATDAPDWHALLAPLPADAAPSRVPVANDDVATHPEARAIAGWHQLTVELSAGERGHRHVLVVLDAGEGIVSANDGVLVASRRGAPDGRTLVEYAHESLGGRFADDGSFHGKHWRTVTEGIDGEDEVEQRSSKSRPPTAEEIDRLRALVVEMIRRAPPRT